MVSNFHSLAPQTGKIDAKLVLKILETTRRDLKISNQTEVTVLVVGAAFIKNLNRRYRGINKVTDVLSFSQEEGLKLKLPKQANKYLGDIVLCWPQIKKQAKLFGHSLNEEFALLLIHGFLHLLGYEDNTDRQYQKMAKIQDRILIKIYGKNKKAAKKL